jgi:hypothetical protein
LIPSIYQKLQDLIDHGINEECHVVYMLACIRKILEQSNEQWGNLKFYCDWALHARMRGRPAQKIIEIFNEAHTIMIKGEETLPPEIQEISKFSKLTSELQLFLSEHNLLSPEHTFDYWSKFIFLYTSIIEDCPLQFNNNFPLKSKINKVTTKVELSNKPNNEQKFYKVSWLIEDLDGKTCELFVINSFGT